MNNVVDVIMNRMSLRKYDERPISREHADVILECAISQYPKTLKMRL